MIGSILGGGGGGGDSGGGGIGGFINAPLSLASHFMRAKAQKKALKAQQKAIQSLKSIDVEDYKKQANLGDRQYYVNRLENLRQVDPDLAAARSAGVKSIYEALAGEGAAKGKELTAMIAEEAGALNPQYKALEQSLIQKAQEHLALGSSFSPDYQAELIRTGLESAGTTGVGPNRTGALAQMLGKAIGREGVALQLQREAAAQGLLNNAQNMRTQRLAALQGILPYAQGLPQMQLGVTGMQLANQYGPGGGLSGNDVLNMLEQNRQMENQKIMQLAGIKAQGALLQGEKVAGAIDIANRATAGLVNTAANAAANYFSGGMAGNMFGSSNPNVGSSLSPPTAGWDTTQGAGALAGLAPSNGAGFRGTSSMLGNWY